MGLEVAAYINDLVPTNPVGATDGKAQGDDHIRLIKSAVQATFPGMSGRFSRVQGKTGNYTVLATDNTTVLYCTGSVAFTLALTAAATLGNGFNCLIINASTADVTIDPDGAETVNSAATMVLGAGRSALLTCYNSAGSEFVVAVIDPILTVYTASGTDTYTVSGIGAVYKQNYVYLVKFPNANSSTTPTINFDAAGAKTIKRPDGGALRVADITTNMWGMLLYDGTDIMLLNPARPNEVTEVASVGVIKGLTLSNSVGDPNNDIDIAIGKCADTTDSFLMSLVSGLTKQLDAIWAVGTGAGGLDTGTKLVSTWYHVWLIRRSDTGVVDALFSQSATAPTMPGAYDQKRRLGAVKTDGSGNLLPFTQIGDEFFHTSTKTDFNTSSTTYTTKTLSFVPTGVKVKALCFGTFAINGGLGGARGSLKCMDGSGEVTLGATNVAMELGGHSYVSANAEIWTDTSAQVQAIMGLAMAMTVNVIGWLDLRGRYG